MKSLHKKLFVALVAIPANAFLVAQSFHITNGPLFLAISAILVFLLLGLVMMVCIWVLNAAEEFMSSGKCEKFMLWFEDKAQ